MIINIYQTIRLNSLRFTPLCVADGQFSVQFANLTVESHRNHNHDGNQYPCQSHKQVELGPLLLIHVGHHQRTHYQLNLTLTLNRRKQTRIVNDEEESSIKRTHPRRSSDVISDIDITTVEKGGGGIEETEGSRLDEPIAGSYMKGLMYQWRWCCFGNYSCSSTGAVLS